MTKKKSKIKKAGEYAWNYAKMSGLFPDFKESKKKEKK